jgi:hypothetical protein
MKYITQPTMTLADTIMKALNNLTQALKEKINIKGLEQIKALKKLDNILSNTPVTAPTPRDNPAPEPRQVTFDQAAKPPQESEPNEGAPSPRVNNSTLRTTAAPITTATTDKPTTNMPTPRMHKTRSTTNDSTPKLDKNSPIRIEMRDRMREHPKAKTMARILQRNMYLCQNVQRMEQAQLIHDKETNTYLSYCQLLHHPKYKESWVKSALNEFGHLAQELKDGRVKGTNTIKFICKDQVPAERMKDVTYRSFSCNYKPNKEEKERTRLTAGGNRINYPDDCGTPTADMTHFKILINSILSTPKTKCIMMDIKDFYLRTPITRPEYMQIKITDILDEIIQQYNLMSLVTQDGYVYCKITRGMYSLPQSGIIVQELLKKRLAEYGYHKGKIINSFWKHNTRPICFALVIDDFAVKYITIEDTEHLINVIKKYYPMTVDKEATKYIGLTIEWDYMNQKAHIHMLGYLQKALIRFKHKTLDKI